MASMGKPMWTIAIIGNGGWGTALAIHLAQKGIHVNLWGASGEYMKILLKRRENIRFLPGIKIPLGVTLTADFAAALKGADILVLAIPSQYAVEVLKRLKPFQPSDKIILSVVKGIEMRSLLRMSEIIQVHLGKVPVAVLSGPTIASEVAKGFPSSAVIASKNMRVAKTLQAIFNSKRFRVYTNADVVGVELGGSIKNIIAIACGVCDGLGFGTNAKAALVARGLAEMARLGKAMGARRETFSGLSGLGDLVTTCFNTQSRNRFVGEQLGKGMSIEGIIKKVHGVAEGIATVKAAFKLSKKHNVAMPITQEVYKVIYKNKPPLRAVCDLLERIVKSE